RALSDLDCLEDRDIAQPVAGGYERQAHDHFRGGGLPVGQSEGLGDGGDRNGNLHQSRPLRSNGSPGWWRLRSGEPAECLYLGRLWIGLARLARRSCSSEMVQYHNGHTSGGQPLANAALKAPPQGATMQVVIRETGSAQRQ